jgi:CHAT domain-containing protein/Tfp pilus assembly protein PilF
MHRKLEWQAHWSWWWRLVSLIALSALAGCKPDAVKQPQAVYARIESLLIHGNLEQAHQKAQLASEQLSQENSEWSWKFRLLDARVLLREGKNNEVLTMLSMEKLPQSLASSDIALYRAVLQAWAYTYLGRRDEARQALQRAQILLNNTLSSKPSMLRGQILNAWGVLYLQQGDLVHAEDIFRQDLEVARQQNDVNQQAGTLLNLGVVALRQERFDEALSRSEAAVQAVRKIDAKGLLEKSQGNIAWANYQLGNFEEALSGFRTAEEGAKTLGEVDDRMEWLNNIGLSLYRLGHPQEAETYYNNALQIADSYHDVEEEIAAHVALAELFLQSGNLALSTEHMQKALAIAHSAGRSSDEMDALFLKGLIAARENSTAEATQILTSLDQDGSIRPSLRWQVEGGLAKLNDVSNQVNLADQWYRHSIATFETQRKTIKSEDSRLPFSTNADQLYSDYIHFLVHHQKTDEALQWLDQGRARTLEEGLGIASTNFSERLEHPLNTSAIARKLHGTILVYSLAANESYLWAITAKGTHFFKLPPRAQIDEHVRNYQRAILASRDTLANSYVDGLELYKILVQPAADFIPKNSPVFIIPDGSLQTLNFETLLAPGGGLHYWIEDAIITNASSLKLLEAFQSDQLSNASKKLLLIGNPVSPEERFPDLPNAAAEISSVAGHFSPAGESVYTQKQALPSSYTITDPGQFSYIHFVAHGTSSSSSPLDSAIVLTRSPENPDSFKLYARDVMKHRLHADLVTISACYGSGSRIYGGEGLIGLSWAFLRAGSHYVIGSLWEVSDAATPQLMDRMYGELAAGHAPDTALRDAKLSLLHSQGIYRKPLYWATFQLYGGS